MVVMLNAALPVLVTVTVCGALGPPPVALVISTSPKFTCGGDKLKSPTPPWPALKLTPPNNISIMGAINSALASGVASFLFCTGLVSIRSRFTGHNPKSAEPMAQARPRASQRWINFAQLSRYALSRDRVWLHILSFSMDAGVSGRV